METKTEMRWWVEDIPSGSRISDMLTDPIETAREVERLAADPEHKRPTRVVGEVVKMERKWIVNVTCPRGAGQFTTNSFTTALTRLSADYNPRLITKIEITSEWV